LFQAERKQRKFNEETAVFGAQRATE